MKGNLIDSAAGSVPPADAAADLYQKENRDTHSPFKISNIISIMPKETRVHLKMISRKSYPSPPPSSHPEDHLLINPRIVKPIPVTKSSGCLLLPSFMIYSYEDPEAESIYRQYYAKEKQSDFPILVKILFMNNIILLSLFTATTILSTEPITSTLLICLTSLCASLMLVITSAVFCSKTNPWIWTMLPVFMWIVQVTHVVCYLWLYPVARLPPDSISLVLLYTYTTYVIFPVRLRYCVMYSILLAILHIVLVSTSSVTVPDIKPQLLSNILLFTCVNILGIMSSFFYEKEQRRSFLETCQSLEAKLVLEEESQEQVRRTLLSIFRHHFMSTFRK